MNMLCMDWLVAIKLIHCKSTWTMYSLLCMHFWCLLRLKYLSLFLLLDQRLVDSLCSGQNIPTVLQSIGCMAQHSVLTYDAQEKEITKYIVEEIFQGKDVSFYFSLFFPFHFHRNLCTVLSYIDSCSILFILHVFLEPCTRVLWFIWRDFKVLQYLQVKGKHFFDFKVHYNFWKMFSVICSLYVIHLCIGAIFPVQSTSCPKRCKIDKYWTFVCNVNR